MRALKLAVLAGLAVLSTATPSLACFPADPRTPQPSPAEIAVGRRDYQQQLWDISPSVYLGRVVSVTWFSEERPGPRDMGVDLVIEGVAPIKGSHPDRLTIPLIVCDPQDHARATLQPGALMIVYARRMSLFDDWRRAGDWVAYGEIPVNENADPRIGSALREPGLRLRSTGR